MNSVKGILVLFLCLVIFIPCVSGAEFSIEAQVDKTEVAFGESLTLLITISQQLGSGGTSRMLTPNIDQIPGFDIASSRTGQSTSYINGYGSAKNQVVYELVPKEPGKKSIPSFSFTDPEGKTHSTKAIEINVLPPVEESAEEPEAPQANQQGNETGKSSFKGLLIIGMIFALLVAIPFVLSAIYTRKQKPTTRWQENSNSGLKKKSDPNVVDAEIVDANPKKSPPIRKKIDFSAAVLDLKRNFPEVNSDFYHQYFAIFKQASIGKSQILSDDMTPDEMLEQISTTTPSATVRQAAERLAKDIEMVMYAGNIPSRTFALIDEDVRSLLIGID